MKQSKTKITIKDYIKANRKGSRDAELEVSSGFSSKHKIHNSKKAYKRAKHNWEKEDE